MNKALKLFTVAKFVQARLLPHPFKNLRINYFGIIKSKSKTEMRNWPEEDRFRNALSAQRYGVLYPDQYPQSKGKLISLQ